MRFPLTSASVSVVFIVADDRTHDFDNLIASFKAGQDGAFTDAGILAGDSTKVIKRIAYGVERGAKAGVRVVLEEGA